MGLFKISVFLLLLSVISLKCLAADFNFKEFGNLLCENAKITDYLSESEKLFESQFHAFFEELKIQYGKCLNSQPEKEGIILLNYEKGYVKVAVGLNEAQKVSKLRVIDAGYNQKDESLEQIKADFNKIDSVKALFVKDYTHDKVLLGYNEELSLAVGSSFKLAILKTLQEGIINKTIKSDTVLKIRKELKSLPAGILQDFPDDSPVTVDTLANLMIKMSDNTATDLLINFLGKDKIVKNLPPENDPLLTTRDMFYLKSKAFEKEGKSWGSLNRQDKVKLLEKIGKANLEYDNIMANFNTPNLIETVEWKISARLMCELAYALKENPYFETDSDSFMKKENWKWMGSKGGSEPGVWQHTILLKNKKDNWFCVSETYNNAKENLSTLQVQETLGRIENWLVSHPDGK